MKYWLLLIAFLGVLIILFYPMTAQSDDDKMELSGQIRARSELDGKDFNNDTPAKRATLLRVRLNAAFQPADKISTFIQLQDSREYGTEPGTLADTHNIDLHQAYLQANDFLVDKLTLKMGRMELIYAGERLIGAVGWDNVGRAFDGTVLRYQASRSFTVDLLGTKNTAQADVKAPDDTGFYFGGLYTTYQPKKTYRLDVYALGEWNRKQTMKDEDDLRRITFGTYDRGELDAIDYEVEVAAQIGKRYNPNGPPLPAGGHPPVDGGARNRIGVYADRIARLHPRHRAEASHRCRL
ncbi:alginate export family protein [Candidatus Poribacteria bacterium]|nr:alginate export family protein [Candidatus Poribacteria bacterium]